MSYILQALKKAEEARGATPRAVPMPRAFPPASRRRWPWIAGGLGAGAAIVAVVAALWAFAPVTTDAPARTTVVTALPSPAVVTTHATGVEPSPAAAREPTAPSPPVDAGARLEPSSPAAERSSGTRAEAEREAVPPRERPSARAAARVEPMRPPPPTKRSVAAVAPPAAQPERVIPPQSVAAPAASAAPAGSLKAMIAKLSLQVLSWSPDPKDRFVFISGRKYVEGQAIDDKLLVERITDGGVVLSYQGERATLKSP